MTSPSGSRVHRENSLCSALTGCVGVGARELVDRALGHPDASDLARGDELCEGADALLDRDVRIDAVQVVEIERVEPEAGERVLAVASQRLRASVADAILEAALGGDHDSGRAVAQRACDERLVVTGPVLRRRCRSASRRVRGRAGRRAPRAPRPADRGGTPTMRSCSRVRRRTRWGRRHRCGVQADSSPANPTRWTLTAAQRESGSMYRTLRRECPWATSASRKF